MHQDDTHGYKGPDRRAMDAAAFQMMVEAKTKTLELEKHMTEKIDDLKDDLDAHMVKSEVRHNELTERIEHMSQSMLSAINKMNVTADQTYQLFKRAIPNDDPEGHKVAHEGWIKKAEQEEKFWLDVKSKAVSAVVIAVLGWIGLAIWTAFLQGPK
jgi:hypothetical protein